MYLGFQIRSDTNLTVEKNKIVHRGLQCGIWEAKIVLSSVSKSTDQLICAFVFRYVKKNRFSYDAVRICYPASGWNDILRKSICSWAYDFKVNTSWELPNKDWEIFLIMHYHSSWTVYQSVSDSYLLNNWAISI